MRPNINISHTLNGRVKDYAEDQDVSLEEAYEKSSKQDWKRWNIQTNRSTWVVALWCRLDPALKGELPLAIRQNQRPKHPPQRAPVSQNPPVHS